MNDENVEYIPEIYVNPNLFGKTQFNRSLMENGFSTSSDHIGGISFVVFSSVVCMTLAMTAVIVNCFVAGSLLYHRKILLRKVFYVIVLHCGIVDGIRSFWLFIICLPFVFTTDVSTRNGMLNRLVLMKMSQTALVFLRSANLLTIINLLVFTINEYIVIKHPFKYRRIFRRKIVAFILALGWFVSGLFGVSATLIRNYISGHTKFVAINKSFNSSNTFDASGLAHRRWNSHRSANTHFVFLLFLISLSYACLLCVLLCYTKVLAAIRRYHTCEIFQRQPSMVDANSATMASAINVEPLPATGTCSSNHRASPTTRSRGNQRWQVHIQSRHKYLLVIGSILMVDLLFILPYSAIQMLAYLHFEGVLKSPLHATYIRSVLQILIALHTVCQPFCYFRMKEFRSIALCWRFQRSATAIGVHSSTWRSVKVTERVNTNSNTETRLNTIKESRNFRRNRLKDSYSILRKHSSSACAYNRCNNNNSFKSRQRYGSPGGKERTGRGLSLPMVLETTSIEEKQHITYRTFNIAEGYHDTNAAQL